VTRIIQGSTVAKQPVHPLVAGGTVAFVVGILLWAWMGRWQWALTGAAMLLLSGVLVSVRGDKSRSVDHE
jgi:hypothetical protein